MPELFLKSVRNYRTMLHANRTHIFFCSAGKCSAKFTHIGEAHWAVEYNVTQYYGLREVSAASLDNLAEKIRNYHDRSLLTKYLTALRVRHNTDVSDCDAACVHVHFCAITRADFHEFRSCVSNPASALASRAPHNSAAIILYAILILISS